MDYQKLLSRFEEFLASIPLERYREELLPVKTVEQDLPKNLNPLPAIYEKYWLPKEEAFPDYDEFFRTWWTNHLKPLDDFIRQYFWGCSHEFVYIGFKARIYRTLVSVLTQFHFAYSWLAHCHLPLEASAELDMKGIDALVTVHEVKVALQIKKETYRSEARESGRFARRREQTQLVIEVPYTVTRPENWRQRAQRARTSDRKEQAQLFSLLSEKFQRWLPNGFVIFQPDYPRLIEEFVIELAPEGSQRFINWQETLKWLKDRSS